MPLVNNSADEPLSPQDKYILYNSEIYLVLVYVLLILQM